MENTDLLANLETVYADMGIELMNDQTASDLLAFISFMGFPSITLITNQTFMRHVELAVHKLNVGGDNFFNHKILTLTRKAFHEMVAMKYASPTLLKIFETYGISNNVSLNHLLSAS